MAGKGEPVPWAVTRLKPSSDCRSKNERRKQNKWLSGRPSRLDGWSVEPTSGACITRYKPAPPKRVRRQVPVPEPRFGRAALPFRPSIIANQPPTSARPVRHILSTPLPPSSLSPWVLLPILLACHPGRCPRPVRFQRFHRSRSTSRTTIPSIRQHQPTAHRRCRHSLRIASAAPLAPAQAAPQARTGLEWPRRAHQSRPRLPLPPPHARPRSVSCAAARAIPRAWPPGNGLHSDRHASWAASSGADSWTSQDTIKGLFGSRRHTPVKISTDKGLRYVGSPARRQSTCLAFFVCARHAASLFQIPSPSAQTPSAA